MQIFVKGGQRISLLVCHHVSLVTEKSLNSTRNISMHTDSIQSLFEMLYDHIIETLRIYVFDMLTVYLLAFGDLIETAGFHPLFRKHNTSNRQHLNCWCVFYGLILK